MSNIDFICPTCKRPTHPTDNEIIEHLVKEKDRYRDILGERTKELIRTRKALDVAKDKLDTVRQYHRGTAVIRPDDIAAYCDRALEQITALEQKDVK